MKFKAKQKLLNGALIKGLSTVERRLNRHGEAHAVMDILPQFTALCEKVEKIDGKINFKLNDGPIHNHSVRIKKLEDTVEGDEIRINNLEVAEKMQNQINRDLIVQLDILTKQVKDLNNTVNGVPL